MCASHRPLRLCLVTPRYWLDRGFPLWPRAAGSRLARRRRAAGCGCCQARCWSLRARAACSSCCRCWCRSEPPVVFLPPVSRACSHRRSRARLPVRVRPGRWLTRPQAAGSTTLDLSTVEVPALSSTGTKPLPSAMAPLTAAAVAHAMRMFSSASRLLALKPAPPAWRVGGGSEGFDCKIWAGGRRVLHLHRYRVLNRAVPVSRRLRHVVRIRDLRMHAERWLRLEGGARASESFKRPKIKGGKKGALSRARRVRPPEDLRIAREVRACDAAL